VIAATSLSAFSSRPHSVLSGGLLQGIRSAICRDRSDQHHGKFARITEGEVENDDNDEFGPEK